MREVQLGSVLHHFSSLLFAEGSSYVTFAFQRPTSHCMERQAERFVLSLVLSSGCPTNQPPAKGKGFLPSPADSLFALKARVDCFLISAVMSWSPRAGSLAQELSYSLLVCPGDANPAQPQLLLPGAPGDSPNGPVSTMKHGSEALQINAVHFRKSAEIDMV